MGGCEMKEGLQASIDRDLLPAWRRAKDEAYLAGMSEGKDIADGLGYGNPFTVRANGYGGYPDHYLQYMYLLGVGQAIANHGRDIVGAENLAAKALDTEGKKR